MKLRDLSPAEMYQNPSKNSRFPVICHIVLKERRDLACNLEKKMGKSFQRNGTHTETSMFLEKSHRGPGRY